jgi:protein SCO1/2
MSKKAVLALGIAILIPVISYLILKTAGESAVSIPKHYLPDSVIERTVEGKWQSDTIWHTLPNFHLVNQFGDSVNLYTLKGKIIVMDFIFTSCALVCPSLTANMAAMQRSFETGGDPYKKPDSSIVHFISFSIDPERDSTERLRKFGDKYNANYDNWWFLTGPRDTIYQFITDHLKVDKYDKALPVNPNFIHTDRYVLVDKNMQVRGYYKGLDSTRLADLSKDIATLMLAKDVNDEVNLPFDPLLMAIFFVLALITTVTATTIIFKRKQNK